MQRSEVAIRREPRRVLVTGASNGIGRATLRRLLADGYRPIGLSRSQPADLDEAEEFHCCDLSDLDATRDLIAELTREEPLYGLVNNAALGPETSLADVSREEMDATYRVDVLAPVELAKAVVPGMRMLGCGRIVNLSSRAALGKVNRTAYSAAKAAIIGMTRTWALELAPYAITANVICPGPIDTEAYHSAAAQEPEQAAAIRAAVPLARIGSPDEVANVVAFLLDDLSGFITGETIHI